MNNYFTSEIIAKENINKDFIAFLCIDIIYSKALSFIMNNKISDIQNIRGEIKYHGSYQFFLLLLISVLIFIIIDFWRKTLLIIKFKTLY